MYFRKLLKEATGRDGEGTTNNIDDIRAYWQVVNLQEEALQYYETVGDILTTKQDSIDNTSLELIKDVLYECNSILEHGWMYTVVKTKTFGVVLGQLETAVKLRIKKNTNNITKRVYSFNPKKDTAVAPSKIADVLEDPTYAHRYKELSKLYEEGIEEARDVVAYAVKMAQDNNRLIPKIKKILDGDIFVLNIPIRKELDKINTNNKN